MAVQGGGELGQTHRNIYPIMNGVEYTWLRYLFSDLNDLDTCFVSRKDDDEVDEEEEEEEEDDDDGYNKVIYKCNIHTGECSKMKMYKPFYGRALQIKLPWWPTPAPTIRSCKSRDLSEK
ncbi:hypothetical protein ACLB2K_051319 [Fragaria x ananassa]